MQQSQPSNRCMDPLVAHRYILVPMPYIFFGSGGSGDAYSLYGSDLESGCVETPRASAMTCWQHACTCSAIWHTCGPIKANVAAHTHTCRPHCLSSPPCFLSCILTSCAHGFNTYRLYYVQPGPEAPALSILNPEHPTLNAQWQVDRCWEISHWLQCSRVNRHPSCLGACAGGLGVASFCMLPYLCFLLQLIVITNASQLGVEGCGTFLQPHPSGQTNTKPFHCILPQLVVF